MCVVWHCLVHHNGVHTGTSCKRFVAQNDYTIRFQHLNIRFHGICKDNFARSGWPQKLYEAAKAFIDAQMRKNEMTSPQIQRWLARRGVTVHASTVQRSRKEQGWTLQNTRCCQLIRDANKIKCPQFAEKVIDTGDTVSQRSALCPFNNSVEHAPAR